MSIRERKNMSVLGPWFREGLGHTKAAREEEGWGQSQGY